MLGKRLHRLQWIALVLLTGGVTLAETATQEYSVKTSSDSRVHFGVFLVIIQISLSGFSGVFSEMMFKNPSKNMTFYLKNMLMYFWGAVVNGLVLLIKDGGRIVEEGFFVNYDGITCTIVFLLALGGLAVAIIITQLDNIAKVYVTCVSIFLTSILSYFIFDFRYSLPFVIGLVVVSSSVLVYHDPTITQQQNLPETNK
jgi:UDP-sugar transporter A1/2/3